MNKAINRGNGHYRVGEDTVPIAESVVGRDQHASGFVAVRDELKEHAGLYFAALDVSDVV